MKLGRILNSASLCLLLGGAAGIEPDTTTQSVMRRIFAPTTVILPLSFNSEAFSDPKNTKVIGENIDKLTLEMGNLANHAKGHSDEFQFIAGALARDVRNAARLFHSGQFDQARFVFHNLIENCVSCHSSLPEAHKFQGAEPLIAAIKKEDLEDSEAARFLVMSRQFDDALALYEKMLVPKPSDPVGFADMLNYLKLAIRVKRDLKRPQLVMEKFAAEPSVTRASKQQFQKWISSLKELDSLDVMNKKDLKTARKLITDGRNTMDFPRDRDAMIHFLAANAILSELVYQGKTISRLERAEAYYLLGVTDSMLDDSFWLSRLEFDLETAIRSAPEANFAPKAYAMLEESYILGFTGSSGTSIPKDVADRLRELKDLVEGAAMERAVIPKAIPGK